MLSKVYVKHLTAIGADAVTRSNVIGMRKIFNAQDRRDHGWSVGRTAPKITAEETARLRDALESKQPRVTGILQDTGIRMLQHPRYRNRWTPTQQKIIDTIDYFRLIGFEKHEHGFVPVYRAFSKRGRFVFRVIPWQAGGTGPVASV